MPVARGAVQPDGWLPPRGYSNGYIVGDVLFVAGQVGWDAKMQMAEGFVPQFAQALQNVRAVLDAAAVPVENVGRITIYVTDKRAYIAASREIGQAWRATLGRHYPAMTLVQVADLLEEGAMVEIEATAVVSRIAP